MRDYTERYTDDEIRTIMFDGACPGICRECGVEALDNIEPAAEGYNCPACGGKGCVDSALVYYGIM